MRPPDAGYRYRVTRGAASVYAVVAQLLSRGAVPAVPTADVDGVDLVVGPHTVQVKTARMDRGRPKPVQLANTNPRYYLPGSRPQGYARSGVRMYQKPSAASHHVFVSHDFTRFWIVGTADLADKRATALRTEWENRWDLLTGGAAA